MWNGLEVGRPGSYKIICNGRLLFHPDAEFNLPIFNSLAPGYGAMA
jgi:hypothetical protein